MVRVSSAPVSRSFSVLIPIAGAYLGAGVAVLLLVMIRPLEALWFLVFLVARRRWGR